MPAARTLLRSRIAWTAAAATLAAGFLVAESGSTVASTPSEGSISDTTTSTAWGGGPFLVPNTTDAPDCSLPASCDDFTLNVSTPAGYGDTHLLEIKVSWPNTAADFDVYVLDAAGNTVGAAASSADPESVALPPTTGKYTVRVVPYTPLGDSYSATATLKTASVTPPPGTSTPPGFTNYAAPNNLGNANNAGEPSIGNNWKTGATMYQAGLSTFKATFDDSVTPAKATWTDVSASLASGCPQGSTASLDPILWTDHQTGRTIESQLSGFDSLSCTTDDDGASWLPSQGGGIPSGIDHQSIGGGPYSPNGVGPLPTSSYPNIVYYCSQDIATAFCAASRDGGTTFGVGVPTYTMLECSAGHGHITVSPDGTAYLPNKDCGADQAAVVSTDNGASWSVMHVPGATPGRDPSIGVGANNTAYFGFVDGYGKPGVAVSRDHGHTWTDLQSVGQEFGIQNAVFPTMVAGDDDRAALAYLGTPTGGDHQDTANFKGVWHLYVSTTYDGGKTWQTSDATPNDPVQRGSICTSGTTCGDDRNLLDFIGSTIDKQGRVLVAYADGCIGSCVTDETHTSGQGPADAQASYATIARQSAGKTLFAAFDPAVTNVTVQSLTVTKNRSGQVVATIVVKNTGNTAVSGLATQVLDGRNQVALITGTSLAGGATTTLTATWKASGGSHTITAVVDPQNTLIEADEADNKALFKLSR